MVYWLSGRLLHPGSMLMFPHAGCLCSLSDPALTRLCCQENPHKYRPGSEGHNQWVMLCLEDATRYCRGLSLDLRCLASLWITWRKCQKGNLVESADGMKLGRPMTIRGNLDRLWGWAPGNWGNSARRGCAHGKEEPTEKIKAGEETTQGIPLWKIPQKAWKLGRSLGKALLLHHIYTYYFSYQGTGNNNWMLSQSWDWE